MSGRSVLAFPGHTLEVVAAGGFTTVQDYPGRIGYWAVGVPPSGPMDPLAFRLGNRLLGNSEGAAGLEMTLGGPTLLFHRDSVICLTGAQTTATLDGEPVSCWKPIFAAAGSTLRVGNLRGPGCRTYLLVRGGLAVPEVLGSRSTFTLGRFGGHLGRTLAPGDQIPLNPDPKLGAAPGAPLRFELVPAFTHDWQIGVTYGPHGAPDFFTAEDIEMLFSVSWEVHYNSARTGVRLLGPKPRWARADGGEAGLHPSNIHDNPYAVGAIDFTGDMPVVLGPDGPSLGGFVCPGVVVQGQLWKLGQLAPRDRVRFVPVTLEAAGSMERVQDESISELAPAVPARTRPQPVRWLSDPVLARTRLRDGVEVAIRTSGDRYALIEFGPNVLDLDLRFRAHALQTALEAAGIPGVLDLTPGIRSLQVHFDARLLPRDGLLPVLLERLSELSSTEDLEIAGRIVHLPLSWDDPAVGQTIDRYMHGVRRDAPWCPSNIEFIRRINGLDSEEDVKRILFDASYLVLGLGDVYLGAPVATPLDPRHRLVTTKYNPARTWTPPNVVGIGGAYLCVYGMEGPGGYQLVGRTLQMWSSGECTSEFVPGKPWLLRFFDQIRFFPVSAEELLEIRQDFPHGLYRLHIEPTVFRLREYHAFLASIRDESTAFKQRQQAAFERERRRWELSGEIEQRPDRASAGNEPERARHGSPAAAQG